MTADGTTSSPPTWNPGSRVSRLRASHTYRYVLLMIVLSFVFAAAAPDKAWGRSVLVLIQAATLVVALWTSGLKRYARASLVLVALAVLSAVGLVVSPGATIAGLVGIFELLLTVGIVVTVAFGVIDQGEINAQSVTGAICIYILIGMMFTFLYGAVAVLGSGPFFTQGTDGTLSLRLYFSYVTLATLGYGDYTPSGNLGHTLAIVEALLGQLYLVTVVALLVARMRPRRS
jgi:Ion channel